MHPENAYSPIATFPVNVIEANAEPSNARAPIIVTVPGIVMVANAEHPENADASIVVTVTGKVIFVNAVHPLNVPAGIVDILIASLKSTVCIVVLFDNADGASIVPEAAEILVT
jgi:hypothetical protein